MKKTYFVLLIIIIGFLGVLFGGIYADSNNNSNQSMSEVDSRNKVWELLADADTVFTWGVDYTGTSFFPVKTYRIDDKHIEMFMRIPEQKKPVILKNIEVSENADLRKFSAVKMDGGNCMPVKIVFAVDEKISQGFVYQGMGENSEFLAMFPAYFLTLSRFQFGVSEAQFQSEIKGNFPYIIR